MKSPTARAIIDHMSTTRTTSPHSGPTDLPTWSGTWAVPAEDLEAMLATDDDVVDTALIPTLAFRDAVEESATPGASAVAAAPAEEAAATDTVEEEAATDTLEVAPAPASVEDEPVAPPVGHNLRSRHATPESKAAIRRNLIAVCCVAVSVVIIGIAAGLVGGWIAVAAYTLLVVVAAVALRRANARYAPRHSRYTARHA